MFCLFAVATNGEVPQQKKSGPEFQVFLADPLAQTVVHIGV